MGKKLWAILTLLTLISFTPIIYAAEDTYSPAQPSADEVLFKYNPNTINPYNSYFKQTDNEVFGKARNEISTKGGLTFSTVMELKKYGETDKSFNFNSFSEYTLTYEGKAVKDISSPTTSPQTRYVPEGGRIVGYSEYFEKKIITTESSWGILTKETSITLQNYYDGFRNGQPAPTKYLPSKTEITLPNGQTAYAYELFDGSFMLQDEYGTFIDIDGSTIATAALNNGQTISADGTALVAPSAAPVTYSAEQIRQLSTPTSSLVILADGTIAKKTMVEGAPVYTSTDGKTVIDTTKKEKAVTTQTLTSGSVAVLSSGEVVTMNANGEWVSNSGKAVTETPTSVIKSGATAVINGQVVTYDATKEVWYGTTTYDEKTKTWNTQEFSAAYVKNAPVTIVQVGDKGLTNGGQTVTWSKGDGTDKCKSGCWKDSSGNIVTNNLIVASFNEYNRQVAELEKNKAGLSKEALEEEKKKLAVSIKTQQEAAQVAMWNELADEYKSMGVLAVWTEHAQFWGNIGLGKGSETSMFDWVDSFSIDGITDNICEMSMLSSNDARSSFIMTQSGDVGLHIEGYVKDYSGYVSCDSSNSTTDNGVCKAAFGSGACSEDDVCGSIANPSLFEDAVYMITFRIGGGAEIISDGETLEAAIYLDSTRVDISRDYLNTSWNNGNDVMHIKSGSSGYSFEGSNTLYIPKSDIGGGDYQKACIKILNPDAFTDDFREQFDSIKEGDNMLCNSFVKQESDIATSPNTNDLGLSGIFSLGSSAPSFDITTSSSSGSSSSGSSNTESLWIG